MRPDILIIDDDAEVVESLRGILEDEGYRVRSAPSGEAGIDAVSDSAPDLVFLDIQMPGGMDGMEALGRIREASPNTGVVMISGHGSIEVAVRAINLGAVDFIEKPPALDEVVVRTAQALEKMRLRGETVLLQSQLASQHEIIGGSDGIRSILQVVARVAPTNARVLITGESGTGKELIARAIHTGSRRVDRPFVRVNCAAIPTELIEAELFGYEKGAFTGAAHRHAGRFEQADGGSLFLDEVGDMSAHTQAKVLRVLEEGQFERIGGNQTLTVDVRVLAATNRDLPAMIAEDRFREDLYYRLNVVPVTVPPLRERRADILPIARHFLARYCAENAKPLMSLAPEAAEALERYHWRGNIRELRNVVERAVIMTPGDTIRVEDLPADSIGSRGTSVADAPSADLSLRDAREEFETAYIRRVLEESGWNVSEAAKRLGIERSHLHRKMRQADLRRDA